jgi:cell division protein FtsL
MAKPKKNRYGQNAVNGSLAYDYDNPALYPEYEYGKPLDIPERPRVREEVVPKTEVLTKQSISLLAVFGFAAAAVLLVFSLMARIQFTQVSAETAKLESQLSELTEEQSKLTIAYESALNLTDIEDYAINTLGMQKPRADQVRYVSSSAQDKAEILNGTDGTDSNKASDIVDSLREYFG